MSTMRAIPLTAIIIGLSATNTPALLAQGKSNGLNRALSAAAKGSSASGLAKATSKSGNASNRVLRSGSTFGRAGNGLQRANATLDDAATITDGASPTGSALDNQQRILDHRIEQSDHLRTLSAVNGNQHLLDTADRMQANATTNFERQKQRLNSINSDPATGATSTPQTPLITADTTSAPLADPPQAHARRGFWFRSR